MVPYPPFCCFCYESLFRWYVTAIPKDYFTTEAVLPFLEEAIFTVFGRSHNWWGAFLVKSCRPSWWNFYPFSCSLSSKSCTLDASYMLRLPRKANSKECSAPPSEMELSDHFVVWSPGYILHKTS